MLTTVPALQQVVTQLRALIASRDMGLESMEVMVVASTSRVSELERELAKLRGFRDAFAPRDDGADPSSSAPPLSIDDYLATLDMRNLHKRIDQLTDSQAMATQL